MNGKQAFSVVSYLSAILSLAFLIHFTYEHGFKSVAAILWLTFTICSILTVLPIAFDERKIEYKKPDLIAGVSATMGAFLTTQLTSVLTYGNIVEFPLNLFFGYLTASIVSMSTYICLYLLLGERYGRKT
ncbi:hypothetical protein DRP05_09320 [Archaeoglobales archaeon]|nr:MAG: hypothetical protein DRP05_09320 [Archaeoglobales archaeon]